MKYLCYSLSLLLLLGCRVPRTGGERSSEGKPGPGFVRLTVDTARLWVEVADRPETRQMGLMFRRELPQDQGMLFVFEEPQVLDFWMKNTYLPLDVAFISSEGTILNIESMRPLDERPRYRSRGPARYALEVNQGWFSRRGIKPGDRIKF